MTEKAPVLQDTLEIPYESEIYVFKIPSPLQHVAIGARQRELLRQTEPSSNGDMTGLDAYTFTLLKALATFEKLITRWTTATWVWTADAKGLPVVDASKFPPQSVLLVMEVVDAYETALDRFLFGRPGDGVPAGAETVASESDSASEPV